MIATKIIQIRYSCFKNYLAPLIRSCLPMRFCYPITAATSSEKDSYCHKLYYLLRSTRLKSLIPNQHCWLSAHCDMPTLNPQHNTLLLWLLNLWDLGEIDRLHFKRLLSQANLTSSFVLYLSIYDVQMIPNDSPQILYEFIENLHPYNTYHIVHTHSHRW